MPEIHNLLLSIDEQLLLFVNGLNTPILDVSMLHFSGKLFWLPLYVFLVAVIIKKHGIKKGVLSLVLLALMIWATDQLSSSVIRPLICRLRPSSPLNPISELLYFVNDSRGGTYGFPSSHAANSCALAAFLILLLKRRWLSVTLIFWAILVSGSRIYLGFHYPTDILAGGILGIGLGYCFYNIFKFLTSIKLFAPYLGHIPD